MKDTKKCRHCQNEIDKKAKVCPSCNRKQEGKAKFIIIGIILILLVLIGVLVKKKAKDSTDLANQITDKQSSGDNKGSDSAKNTGNEKGEAKTSSDPTVEPAKEPKPEPEEESVKIYKDGIYRVGTKIPAGEYVVFTDDDVLNGYMEIASSSRGTLDDAIANEAFSYNTIVTVNDGNYLILDGAYAISIDEAKELDLTREGMFKVGVHLKAGEYKLECTIESAAYVQVRSDSSHDFDSILTIESFEDEKYITVEDGQYLFIYGCHIVQ
jgi:hypothetical protein